MNNSAISYLRFSSSKQRKGASYDRQIEATEKFCAQNNLVLIDKIEDKGISGWNEDNLEETAALGKLLKLIESGAIKKGTTLIVENLDRITRANLTKAIHLVTGILQSGIDIVTTMDGKRYQKDASTTDLMIAIIYLTRGNDESETKSKRVRQAWQKKRQLINDGKFVKLTQHPNWLTFEDGKYIIKNEAAKTIQRIFQMYLSGLGGHVIAKQLIKDSEKPYTRRAKSFTFSSIERVLKNEAVIGTCFAVKPPKKNYWPKIITEEVWYKVQALRMQNNHYKGTRNDVNKINFVSGLAHCARCGGKMVRYSCKTKGKKYHYLTCSKAKYGEHSLDLVSYKDFEFILITGLKSNGFLDRIAKSQTKPDEPDRTLELQGRLSEVKTRLTWTINQMVETMNDLLKPKAISLDEERIELEKQIEKEKIRVNSQNNKLQQAIEFLEKIDSKLDENQFRMQLRDFLRTIVERIDIGKTPKSQGKQTGFLIVKFKETHLRLSAFIDPKPELIDYNDAKIIFPLVNPIKELVRIEQG